MNNSVDVVIIGAGVIGLATGRELARKGVDTLILDGEPVFGSWTSSRNSEVIHAGLYYESQSLKARTCVRGRDLLYAFCNARGVPHRQCGKLVVAVNDAQVQELEQLSRLAHANGADSRLIDIQELRRLEPAVRAAGALFSPNTGIIDSHAYMQALLGEAETYGARLVCRTQVTRIRQSGQGWNVSIAGETEPVVHASWVINSAGLFAQNVSRTVEGMSEQHIPRLRLAKGSYCTYAGRTPFGRLIYPLPEHGGLGVHLTFDMGGQARFGPDVKWVDSIDYSIDLADPSRFTEAVRRWWPEVNADHMSPGYAGVRPKLSGPGESAVDFKIATPAQHGVARFVALYGVESPGLTASMAIAEIVAKEVGDAS